VSEAAKALMAKARESLASAKADLEAGGLNGASSRAYYAMFHAARAALETRGIVTGGQRHGAIIGRFGRTFVKGGSLDPALGRALNKTLELRREGDYDLASPDADDVRTAVQNAEALLQAISQFCAPDDGV
jgi:uncharacterized protein (UPF0332 family)